MKITVWRGMWFGFGIFYKDLEDKDTKFSIMLPFVILEFKSK